MADWNRVQGAQAQLSPGGNVVSFSLTNPVGAGNVMVSECILDTAVGILSAVDDQGNNYVCAQYANLQGGTNYTVGFYPDPDSATFGLLNNGPKTLTVTLSGTPAYFWYDLTEFSPPSGTPGITLAGFNTLTSGSGTTCVSIETDYNDTLLYMSCFSSGAVVGPGTGFNAGAGSGSGICSQWAIQASAGLSPTLAFTSNGGSGSAICMSIAPVKRNNWLPIQCVFNHSGSTGTSIGASLDAPIKNGDYVVGQFANNSSVGGSDTTNLTSFVDDQGKTWPINTITPNFGGRSLFWLGPFTNGAKTLTANVGASSTGLFLAFAEFRPPPGAASVVTDGYAQTQANTSPTTVGPITTSGSHDLIYVMQEPAAGAGEPTDGFSALVQGQTWNMAYRNAPTPGSYSSTWTYGAATNNMYIAGFAPVFPQTNLVLMEQRLIQ